MKDCCTTPELIELEGGMKTIVLVGNPNVGKSVIFGALSGTYADVSNFPGTTVEIKEALFEGDLLIDSPGVYGISNLSDEERVTRDVVLRADIIVNVVDAVHLERDLFLTAQLLDMGIPMLVVVNMIDEAKIQGVALDIALLEELIGVRVVQTVATEKSGINEVKSALKVARAGLASQDFESIIRQVQASSTAVTQAQAVLALEGDSEIAALVGINLEAVFGDKTPITQSEIYVARRKRVNALTAQVITHTTQGAGFGAKLSAAMMYPITGLPMMLAMLTVIWVVIGQWVGVGLVGLLEQGVMQTYWVPAVQWAANAIGLHAESAFFAVLAGEFGVFTMVPTYLIGVILPLVASFYLLLSLLEDTGYLPRIAVLTDRALSMVGLNGRAIIPLILGLGCVTMGTLTTRVLNTKRERVIATALMAIAVPCSAQIAVIAALMGRTKPVYSALFILFLLAVFGVVGAVLNKITPGSSSELLIDLPPLRTPQLSNVFRKTALKVFDFMKEIVIFFAAGALIISTLKITGALPWIIHSAKPLVSGWLGLPEEAATAFVMGFIRRDFGAAGFFKMDLSDAQLLVAMSTITLFVPCIASVMVILKERGVVYFVSLFVMSLVLAFGLGGLMWQGLVAVGLS